MSNAIGCGASGVLVCEPQFRGATHASVNAGLLAAVARAFPNEPLTFAAHASHLDWVRRALPAEDPASAAVWRELPPLPALRRSGRLQRTVAEIRVVFGVLAKARRQSASLVVFTSTTRLGMVLLPLACMGHLTPRVLAVVHQLFELADRPPRRASPSLARLLTLPRPAVLSYVAPSSAVGEALASDHPKIARRFLTLEPAYFWHRKEVPRPPSEAVGFALLGSAHGNRLSAFLDVARQVLPTVADARFRIVGFVPESEDLLPDDALLLGNPSRTPLPVDELVRRRREVHIAVWLGGDDYRLRLSASLLDALSHVLPVVALRTPFVEHLFRQVGDIGILCANESELAETVAGLAAELSADRYYSWCTAILKGRHAFTAAAVGDSLRAACRR